MAKKKSVTSLTKTYNAKGEGMGSKLKAALAQTSKGARIGIGGVILGALILKSRKKKKEKEKNKNNKK